MRDLHFALVLAINAIVWLSFMVVMTPILLVALLARLPAYVVALAAHKPPHGAAPA